MEQNKQSADGIIRDIRRETRRVFSSEEKAPAEDGAKGIALRCTGEAAGRLCWSAT